MIEPARLHRAEAADHGFQPEVLLPSQLPCGRTLTPEQALVGAILDDAIQCVRKYRGARQSRGRRLFRDAERWFLVEQRDWPFSFQRICETLGLDCEAVRRAAGVCPGTEGTSTDPIPLTRESEANIWPVRRAWRRW
jgi:hypothetical protein